MVQRILDTVLWPSPVTAHWVAYQQNLCQIWEWTFSGPWGKMVMNCPLKIMVKFMSKKGLCQLKIDTCHLHLQRLNHDHCNSWLSPWKEFRVKIRNEALCALGKTGRTDLQIVRSFQEKILWVSILASSHT